MRWLAIALVTGCSFSPAGMAGGDITPVDAPDGPQPTVDAPDAPPQIIDTDGDGTPDADDNCPMVANDQHDEDGDGRGDLCDKCPQLAVADTDGDGDGVANACDPHPTLPGDTLLRFETFAGTALPMGWNNVGGNAADWKVMSDALSISSTASAGGRFLVFDTAVLHHTIDLGVTVDAAGTPAPAVTELVDVDAGAHNAIACTARIAGGEGAGFYSENYNNDTFTTVEKINTAPAVGGSYRLFTTLDLGLHCDFVTGTGSHPLNATITSATSRTRVGVRVRDMSVRIPWIAVYTSP